ncbi:MAG: tRNA lysidine(34) synthetase TilS [Prevotella sp.]|nr:tRNA lysidine(34) synthetase TilS [Prevotella sp.]
MGFLDTIEQFIGKNNLLKRQGRYLVALSGGADSVCLLAALRELDYQTEAVHCNFHLRGEESNRDEIFVTDLCKRLNTELHLIHFDTKTYASLHHVSIEMAARELRYRYFEQLRQDLDFDGICVAHHQNDSVETVLMNLLRGTGIHGLTGIKPRNGYILRPLLAVSRTEIEDWLKEQGQDYVTDSTNLEADVMRNKIRLNLMPLLRDITPAADDNILTTARRIGQGAIVYDHAITTALNRLIVSGSNDVPHPHAGSIDIKALLNEPSPESILFEWLRPMHFPPAMIEQISESLPVLQPGREWTSDTHQLTISQGRLLAEPLQEQRPILRIPEPGTYIYDEHTKIRIQKQDGRHISTQAGTASLDAGKVTFPLVIRPVRQGDRFQPFGMKGTKLVSDYLTDRHLSVFEKRRTLVVCDSQGHIIWLAGHRPDARYCIDDSTTVTLDFSFFN